MNAKCPIRPELEQLPPRMSDLPLDERGYPVPWFVGWLHGKPEFRAMDFPKLVKAVKQSLCWVCGKRLGAYKTFVIGPMCGITRTTAEPPSHLECAEWSARNCPFLSRPQMVRRDKDMPPEALPPAGVSIARNPGVTLLWTCKEYTVFNDGGGKPLFSVGEPWQTQWYCEGRAATRAEVEHSIETGLPLLQDATQSDGRDAIVELAKRIREMQPLLP